MRDGNRKPTVERAFELARSGRYRHMRDLRRQLVREGCDDVDRHLAGTGIRKQLLGEAAQARGRTGPGRALRKEYETTVGG